MQPTGVSPESDGAPSACGYARPPPEGSRPRLGFRLTFSALSRGVTVGRSSQPARKAREEGALGDRL